MRPAAPLARATLTELAAPPRRRQLHFCGMTEKRLRPDARIRAWLRARSVWFWAVPGTACSIFALWAGSQFARDRGQSVEWYTGFGQWLGAVGSLIAATVALWIATRDRKEREDELRSADRAQATLVLVELGQPAGEQGHFPIAVTNYGSRPVLDVAFDTARFDEFPNSIPTIDETKRKATVLDSDRNAHTFYLAFVDEAKGAVLQGTRNQHGNWHQEEVDLSKVNAWVRFRDASGIRWRRSSSG